MRMASDDLSTIVHFVNVGQGNMTLIQLDDGKVYLYDCNVTEENEDGVLSYVSGQIGVGAEIDVFVCSHRDADHVRGIKKIHGEFPIQHIWDTGVVGTTSDNEEYWSQLRDIGADPRIKNPGLAAGAWEYVSVCYGAYFGAAAGANASVR